MISRSFQTVRRMREVWKRETYVRAQSFSFESAVKYLHIRRRKIQISPPLGEQDPSNALPQGQQGQSNPHPCPVSPPPPPAGMTLIGAELQLELGKIIAKTIAKTATRQLGGRYLLFGEYLRSWTNLKVYYRR